MNSVMSVVATHWSANVVVLVACTAVVVVHLRGMRATAADAASEPGRPAGPERARAGLKTEAVAFYFGVLTVLLALVSPLGYWSAHYVWVRSLQDLLLAVVAPGLFVLGAPWLILARGAGRSASGRVRGAKPAATPAGPATTARTWGAGPWAPRPRTWRSQPVGLVVAFNVAWWGWHAPLLYDSAVAHPVVYGAEVVTYLGLGIGFWLQLIGSAPLEPQWPPLKRVMLIAGTIVSDTVLAMALGFGSTLVYPAYLSRAHGAFSVIADQQVGGAVLWVLIMPPLIITAVALLIRWLKNEESDELTAGLDRLLEPPTSAWPSRPGLR